jgi:hypothetical protein
VEERGLLEPHERLAIQPQPGADSERELRDVLRVQLQARLPCTEGLEQHVLRAAPAIGAPVLLVVQALVAEVERGVRVGRLLGKEHGAERGADVEAVAALLERCGRPLQQLLDVAVRRCEHEELVTAEPEACACRHRRAEARGESHQQIVPGSMAEQRTTPS